MLVARELGGRRSTKMMPAGCAISPVGTNWTCVQDGHDVVDYRFWDRMSGVDNARPGVKNLLFRG